MTYFEHIALIWQSIIYTRLLLFICFYLVTYSVHLGPFGDLFCTPKSFCVTYSVIQDPFGDLFCTPGVFFWAATCRILLVTYSVHQAPFSDLFCTSG